MRISRRKCGDGVDRSSAFPGAVRLHGLISRHLPSFTICLAAWLALLEACHLATRKPVYRRLFEFWKIFGVTFGLSVVSGIVLAFEFGMNWCGLSEVTGRIQGPLLIYESFTAFCAGGVFLFGVLI
jgi:cytochrome bd ubiquinol oxidase subunit I